MKAELFCSQGVDAKFTIVMRERCALEIRANWVIVVTSWLVEILLTPT